MEEPLFYDSSALEGLQVADAVAYYTNRHINGHSDFDQYWDLIYPKIHRFKGSIDGYGLAVFPRQVSKA